MVPHISFCTRWNRLIEQNSKMTIIGVEGANKSALWQLLRITGRIWLILCLRGNKLILTTFEVKESTEGCSIINYGPINPTLMLNWFINCFNWKLWLQFLSLLFIWRVLYTKYVNHYRSFEKDWKWYNCLFLLWKGQLPECKFFIDIMIKTSNKKHLKTL